eukprot:813225_1
MGASLSECVPQLIISEEESVDHCISDVILPESKVLSSPKKKVVQTNDNDEELETATDFDEFVSQFGSYFSITPSSECNPMSVQSSCSTSYTPYTLPKTSNCASTCTSSMGIQLLHIDVESSNSNHHIHDPNPKSPLSPARSLSLHRKSSTHHNDHEFKLIHMHCQVASCKAIKRIIKMLKWHSIAVNVDDNHEELIQKAMASQYDRYLLDDYQHIVNDHLFQLESIRKEINKQIEPCNVSSCAAYQRFTELVTKDLSQCDDATFCLDFMELIHCYIVHSKF